MRTPAEVRRRIRAAREREAELDRQLAEAVLDGRNLAPLREDLFAVRTEIEALLSALVIIQVKRVRGRTYV